MKENQKRRKTMTMIVYPVQPTVLKSGALASLTQFLDEAQARPIELEAGDQPFKSFRVSSEQISISVAAKLDVSAVFKGSFSYSDLGLIFDAVAFTDKYLDDNSDKPVIMTRWGAGMRVALKVTKVEGSLSANFGAVAAATELNRAQASYEILGLGLGLEARTVYLAMYWRKRGKSESWLVERHPDVEPGLAQLVYQLPEEDLEPWLKT